MAKKFKVFGRSNQELGEVKASDESLALGLGIEKWGMETHHVEFSGEEPDAEPAEPEQEAPKGGGRFRA